MNRLTDWDKLEPTVLGWGILDVDYKVFIQEELPKVGGKRVRRKVWMCPYYADWRGMIYRVICDKRYAGVKIYNEWRYLSKFIEWVDSQPNKNWQNCTLEKDLLSLDTKAYSPDTSVYVSKKVNTFISDGGRTPEGKMLGVTISKKSKIKPYQAQCKNPMCQKRSNYIGVYPTELEAHKAWQAKKHEYACQLAELQEDPRVAEALRQRYAPDKDWTKA